MDSINWVYVCLAVGLYGTHYPLASAYVRLTLRGLPDADRRGILDALRPLMVLLLAIWLLVIVSSIVAVIATRGDDNVIKFIGMSAIMGFHLIWWPFVVPIFRKMEEELRSRGLERSPANAAPTRTARLQPRRASEYLSPWMRALPVEVGIAGIILVMWRLLADPPSQVLIWILSVVFSVNAMFFLIVWSFWVRREVSQSYLADGPAEDAERQIAAAESVRRFRVGVIYWLQIVATALCFTVAVLAIESDHGAISGKTLAIVGGVGGTIVGVAGGVLGIIASVRQHRAQRTTRAGLR